MSINYGSWARSGICFEVRPLVHVPVLSIYIIPGKRYNVLRKRIDSWNYDIDQLLFGTILFTLVAFLFPTTMTYYALFAIVSHRPCVRQPRSIHNIQQIRLAVMSAYAFSDLLLALINEFPLFALLLRVKDPYRLPGRQHLSDDTAMGNNKKSVIILGGIVYALGENEGIHHLRVSPGLILVSMPIGL